MQISKFLGCSLVTLAAVALTACGGGGGGDSGVKVTTSPLPVEPTLLSFVRANFDVTVIGSLDTTVTPNHVIFTDTGKTVDQSLLVTAPVGWINAYPVWMDSYDTPNAAFVGSQGVIKANGKFFATCEQNVQNLASSVASVNYPFQKGTNVFYSRDAQKVTNFTELNGLTFKEFDCAGTMASKTFNADGSFTSNGMQGTTVLTTALFLTPGGVIDEGATKTGSAFKISTPAGLKYFLVTKIDSPLGRYFTLSYQP